MDGRLASYDLISLRDSPATRANNRMRTMLFATSWGTLGFAVIYGIISALNLGAASVLGWSKWFVVAIFAAIGLLTWRMAKASFRDAISVKLDANSVRFTFPNGGSWEQGWAQPNFELTFFVWPPQQSSRGPVPGSIVAFPGRYSTHLTFEAYDAIVERAKAIGLSVTEGLSAPAPKATKTTIRGSLHRPG